MAAFLGFGWKSIGTGCVSARGNHFKLFTYHGPSGFVRALRLTHQSGKIGCAPGQFSNWGCNHVYRTNMFVTDVKNVVMYPSTVLVKTAVGGWYLLPGYIENSPNLVFSDVGDRYIYNGQQMRVWYGEDLYDHTEYDNHGHTCFKVELYFVV